VGGKDGDARCGKHIGVSAWFGGIDVANEGTAEVLLSRVGFLAGSWRIFAIAQFGKTNVGAEWSVEDVVLAEEISVLLVSKGLGWSYLAEVELKDLGWSYLAKMEVLLVALEYILDVGRVRSNFFRTDKGISIRKDRQEFFRGSCVLMTFV